MAVNVRGLVVFSNWQKVDQGTIAAGKGDVDRIFKAQEDQMDIDQKRNLVTIQRIVLK